MGWQCPEEFYKKMRVFSKGPCCLGNATRRYRRGRQPFSTDLWEEMLDSTVTWTVPCKQLWTDWQRAVWLVDGSFKVNVQHPVWKVTTVICGGKNRSAHLAELRSIFLAVMEELNSGRSPYIWVVSDTWAVTNSLAVYWDRTTMKTGPAKGMPM